LVTAHITGKAFGTPRHARATAWPNPYRQAVPR
jgi:hypothetical protein